MSAVLNQEWALAQWREDAAKNDPAPYSVELRHRRPHVWTSVNLNVGWYYIEDGHVFNEATLDCSTHVSPKQFRKMEAALAAII